jgi:hypothetical protein
MRGVRAAGLGWVLLGAVFCGCGAQSAVAPAAIDGSAPGFDIPSPATIVHGPGPVRQASKPLVLIHGNDFDLDHSQRVAAQDLTAVFTPDWPNRTTPATGLAYAVY